MDSTRRPASFMSPALVIGIGYGVAMIAMHLLIPAPAWATD